MFKKYLVYAAVTAVISGGIFFFVQYTKQKAPNRIYRIGVVSYGGAHNEVISGLRDGLKKLGYEEGRDVVYDVVDAGGVEAKARSAAEKFLNDKVDAVYSASTPVTTQVADVIKETPVVFNIVSDPVGSGLTKSMISSGNNLTGCSNFVAQTGPKRLEILKSILPKVKSVLVLYDPTNSFSNGAITTLRYAADILDIDLAEKQIGSKEEVVKVMNDIKPGEYDAFFHLGEAKVSSAADQVIAIANRIKLPTFAHEESLTRKGMLAAYGPSWQALGEQCAETMDKVLQGTAPADIPIQIPKKIEFIINLSTAKTLDINIPEEVLRSADKFFE